MRLRNLGAPWRGYDLDGTELYCATGGEFELSAERALGLMNDYRGRFERVDAPPRNDTVIPPGTSEEELGEVALRGGGADPEQPPTAVPAAPDPCPDPDADPPTETKPAAPRQPARRSGRGKR